MSSNVIQSPIAALQSEPSLVAVLVHGTWSPEAPWTCEGSPFRRQLEAQLGVPIEFRRFRWSGLNTHTHRLEAAADLRQHLKQSLKDNPKSSHFVIAHSHGGNIACYALQDDGLRDAVHGVICLATPFLHVRRSPLPRSLLSATVPTLVILAALAVAYLFLAPEDPATKYLLAGVALLAVPVAALILWALLRKRESRLHWRDLLRPTRNPVEFTKALAFPMLGAERLLAVRISGDEAAGALTTSQFLVWLFRKTWSGLTPIWDRVERLHRGLALFLGFVLAGLALAGWLAVISRDGAETVSEIAVAILALFGVVAIVVGLAAYVVVALMFLMHVPVGLDAMLASLDLQTTAEPTPPGEANVFHVAPRDDASSTSGFSHSALYDNPEVIGFIASWIRVRLKTSALEAHVNV